MGEESTMKNGTLSPCPECGAAFIEINTIGSSTERPVKTHFIRCTKCGYSLGPYVLLQQAIKGWEKIPRSSPDPDKGTEEAAGDLDKPEETVTDMNKPVETEWTKAHRKSPDKISMVMLPIGQLRNHPKNVRKVYADIDDLADSIRTRGVMQNLTVVPAPGHEEALDLFYVVIGNRRLQAAQKAGLSKLPCSIAFNMPEREQISIMVTENMQRSNLSLIEQAEGFQLMLDLGETVQTIHEKTGLSETTVRHRLKLSELGVDQIRKRQAREEKESERYFQLSIKDYEYLEKIKSVKQRRDILDKAENSSNLRWRVDTELKAQQQAEELKKFGKAMLKLGIVRDDKKGSWHSGYEQIKSYRIEAGLPDSVGLPKKYQGKEKKMYWCDSYGTVYIMAPVKKENKTKTAADLEREAQDRRSITGNQLRASWTGMNFFISSDSASRKMSITPSWPAGANCTPRKKRRQRHDNFDKGSCDHKGTGSPGEHPGDIRLGELAQLAAGDSGHADRGGRREPSRDHVVRGRSPGRAAL